MPPRYQQGQLASSAVGTPGIDPSAGKAEAAISEVASKAEALTTQARTQSLQSAETSFDKMQARFTTIANRNDYYARLQKAEQDRLTGVFAASDESDRINQQVAALKADPRFADDPAGLAEAFKSEVKPQIIAGIKENYKGNPSVLRHVATAAFADMDSAANHLASYALTEKNNILEARIAAIPDATAVKLGELKGPLDQMLTGFHDLMGKQKNAYVALAQGALPHQRIKLGAKLGALEVDSGRNFIDVALSKTPDGEAGMKYLDDVRSMAENSIALGIPLSPQDKENMLTHIKELHSGRQQEVITGVQIDTQNKLHDATDLKIEILHNKSNKTGMAMAVRKVDNRLNKINSQIALINTEPDSNIKKTKLNGLKQEKSALAGDLGLDVKMEDRLDNIAMRIQYWVDHNVSFDQNQLRFQQGQEDRSIRMADVVSRDAFTNGWIGVLADLIRAAGLGTAKARQLAVSNATANGRELLNEAHRKGILTETAYTSQVDFLRTNSRQAATVRDQKTLLGFGPSVVVPMAEAKQRRKAELESDQAFGKLMDVTKDLGDFRTDVQTLGLDRGQEAILVQHALERWPQLEASPEFQARSPDAKASFRATWLLRSSAALKRGELK